MTVCVVSQKEELLRFQGACLADEDLRALLLRLSVVGQEVLSLEHEVIQMVSLRKPPDEIEQRRKVYREAVGKFEKLSTELRQLCRLRRVEPIEISFKEAVSLKFH